MRMRAYLFFIFALLISFFAAQSFFFIAFTFLAPLTKIYPQLRGIGAFGVFVHALPWLLDVVAAFVVVGGGHFLLRGRMKVFTALFALAILVAWPAGWANISEHTIGWRGVLHYPFDFWITVSMSGLPIFGLINWIDAIAFLSMALLMFGLLIKRMPVNQQATIQVSGNNGTYSAPARG